MTDLDDIRRDGEEEIAAVMAKLDERHRELLRDALNRYGSVENIPPSVWGQIQEETESELAAIALLLMMGGLAYTNSELGVQGMRTAGTSAAGLSRMGLLAARQVTNAAANSAASLMKRITYALEQARLNQNFGDVGDLTQEGIDKALQDVFDAKRRQGLAIDQTTEALTTGQREAGRAAGTTNTSGQRVTVLMLWRTARDNGVCQRCEPLNDKPEEIWSLVFPNGPGINAHPSCRCYLRPVVVVEENQEAA